MTAKKYTVNERIAQLERMVILMSNEIKASNERFNQLVKLISSEKEEEDNNKLTDVENSDF